MKKYFLTTPIYYVNGQPHIGHIYTTTLADCIARFHRMCGDDTFFLTGCDEHGLKIYQTAEKNGVEPQVWCDRVADVFRQAFYRFHLDSYNRFIRTTDADHVKTAVRLWEILNENGYIYKAKYEGWYNVSDECFVTERDLHDEVIDGKVEKLDADGHICQWSSEENYMFKLTAFKDRLLALYRENEVIIPQFRQDEIIQFIENNLFDVSISRSKQKIHWGIPVPGDDQHVMYVWIDALSNYLTAAKYFDGSTDLWPADVHIIGKDIVRFHCVYWPAFLMAANIPLPKHFLVHGWWTARDGRKMGKSLGNAVDPDAFAKFFGLDALKYYLLSEATPESDTPIQTDLVAAKLNADLANALGNLLNRCVTPKILPGQQVPDVDFDRLGEHYELIDAVEALCPKVKASMTQFRTKDSLVAIFAYVYAVNQLLQTAEPWKLIKSDVQKYNLIMYVAMACLRILGILLLPFMPQKMEELLTQLGIPSEQWIITEENLKVKKLAPGQKVGTEKTILFERVQLVDDVEAPKNDAAANKQAKLEKKKKSYYAQAKHDQTQDLYK